MKRGRPLKTPPGEQPPNSILPAAEEGDTISLTLVIQRVSNGYIIHNKEPDTKEGIMVFNGPEAHRLLTGHVLNLAVADMKEGELITFSSQVTYTKKIPNNGN